MYHGQTGNYKQVTVGNGDYHSLSQPEIRSGMEIYRHLSAYALIWKAETGGLEPPEPAFSLAFLGRGLPR